MARGERFDLILERLATGGSLSVTRLATELGVSAATIRRDLERLEEQNLLVRTHGGANARDVLYELPYRFRDTQYADQKRRIAKAAAAQVREGAVVGLTAGTTTTWIARELVDHQALTIVTNALNIASELVVRPNLKVVVTGGVARSEHYELAGPMAVTSLAGIHIEMLFVGGGGISADAGLSTQDEMAADVNRALMARADRSVAVLDGSKLGRRQFARVCALADLAGLITTTDGDAAEIARLERAGLAVTVA